MNLLSINTALPKTLEIGNKLVTTGFFKEPRNGEVLLDKEGLEGDTIVNRTFHGGEDQAVYLYSAEDYSWWSTQLGKHIPPGMFGENLTITDFHAGKLRVGDRLLINGEVLLEITAPRNPCAKFATIMKDKTFVKQFSDAGRPGAYARVLQTGKVKAGQSIKWLPTDGDFVGIKDIFEEWHKKSMSQSLVEKALNSPIAKIMREGLLRRNNLA